MNTSDFFEHVKTGDLESVKELVDNDPSLVRRHDQAGATPLHYAAFHGHREIARLLINNGADINSRDARFGATPAGWAIEYLREIGGLLAIEIDDMAHAIKQNDVAWATRMRNRFPMLRNAQTADGTPLQELAVNSSDEQVRAIFAAADDGR